MRNTDIPLSGDRSLYPVTMEQMLSLIRSVRYAEQYKPFYSQEMKRNDIAQQFTRIIQWSDEDACYIGSLPEIAPNCCHGDTISEIVAQLDDIAEISLANCKACNIPYDPPGSARIYTAEPQSLRNVCSPTPG